MLQKVNKQWDGRRRWWRMWRLWQMEMTVYSREVLRHATMTTKPSSLVGHSPKWDATVPWPLARGKAVTRSCTKKQRLSVNISDSSAEGRRRRTAVLSLGYCSLRPLSLVVLRYSDNGILLRFQWELGRTWAEVRALDVPVLGVAVQRPLPGVADLGAGACLHSRVGRHVDFQLELFNWLA